MTSSVTELSQFFSEAEAMIQSEINQLERQLAKSRAARGGASVPPAVPGPMDEELVRLLSELIGTIDHIADEYNANLAASQTIQAAEVAAVKEILKNEAQTQSQQDKTPDAEAQVPSSSGPSQTPELITDSQMKGGMLFNYGKDRFRRAFVNQFVVVSDGIGAPEGVSWYESEAAFKKGAAPVDSIPFYIVEKNSRGSVFKKAAACWPLVTDEDCPKVAGQNYTFFGVDYYNPKSQKNDLIVLGASSDAARDQWVAFITKFIALHLPPGPEFEPFINFPVGADPPMHTSQALSGEAPGSQQRVVNQISRK